MVAFFKRYTWFSSLILIAILLVGICYILGYVISSLLVVTFQATNGY